MRSLGEPLAMVITRHSARRGHVASGRIVADEELAARDLSGEGSECSCMSAHARLQRGLDPRAAPLRCAPVSTSMDAPVSASIVQQLALEFAFDALGRILADAQAHGNLRGRTLSPAEVR